MLTLVESQARANGGLSIPRRTGWLSLDLSLISIGIWTSSIPSVYAPLQGASSRAPDFRTSGRWREATAIPILVLPAHWVLSDIEDFASRVGLLDGLVLFVGTQQFQRGKNREAPQIVGEV